MNEMALLLAAAKARQMAYAPYSRFSVGAALLTKDGKVYTGCNVENASYGATNCAERTAFFKAASEGERHFAAIAIVGGNGTKTVLCPPCGLCRQVMTELCDPDFRIILGNEADHRVLTLGDLMPLSFDGDAMEGENGV